jgi:hypothetical protein
MKEIGRMSNGFSPRVEILPPPQIALWPELRQVPVHFALYGGTALALQLGHRQSVDFDFFSIKELDPDHLLDTVPFLRGAQVLQMAANTLDVSVDRGGAIKVSFFGLPNLKRILRPLVCPDNQLQVASLLDLAGTKVSVVQKRSELKDYLDVAAILADGRITLPMALSAGKAIYGSQFNPLISLKALSYFDDGNLHDLPAQSRALIDEAVRRVDLQRLPSVLPTNQPARPTGIGYNAGGMGI